MNRRTEDTIAQILQRLRPKAKSLVITVYGDAVLHHGGNAWLGSIITLAKPLGLDERTVRTAVFRLSKEDWLASTQIGRRSYYRLTDNGRHRFEAAHARIYNNTARPWDGRWTLAIPAPTGGGSAPREALRRDLGWLGFGQLANGIMLHPDPDEAALRQALADTGAQDHTVVMRAAALPWVPPQAVRAVINTCWDMDRLAAEYTAFLDTFRPAWQTLKAMGDLDPESCFTIRILLMHGYRRAILRDPMLPEELLEAHWPGTAARALCRNLYRLIQAPAEAHLMSLLETAEGPAPEAHPSYYTRFGGLTPADGS